MALYVFLYLKVIKATQWRDINNRMHNLATAWLNIVFIPHVYFKFKQPLKVFFSIVNFQLSIKEVFFFQQLCLLPQLLHPTMQVFRR